ncbi:tRNA ligase [[Candida] jaroonii]|uniref:tRNA ligase n=1 Tax=[Candida] jaroonii TaxID=467808 RepID=A0ACA9Y6B7_9ASCO|nr:tRNA ligase [[Candida] jaroonii]
MLDPIVDSDSSLEALSERLEASLSLRKGGSKKRDNSVGEANHVITAWKFNEWDYYRDLVPCKARGLFTLNNKIVTRGYNKFFNIDEVHETKMRGLKKTTGPYTVTVKENGCIIFVSGLEDGTIIVCSKHSTGIRDDLTRNHAYEGEVQLKKLLQEQGKSVESLAKLLHEGNITLVMELCDDSFEEHVLSYKGKEAGLYLHGINFNTIDFKTYPMEDVEKFAKEWGFFSVKWFKFDDFTTLMDYLKDCETTGSWNGREIEGFVVRCKLKSEDFFFKYKFEQPYLIYRHFREVTKQWINERPISDILKKYKDEKFIISKYIEFISNYFHEFPQAKERYLQGFGIISLRKLFLESYGLDSISAMNLFKINEDLKKAAPMEELKNKYIIIPIATIGCGKTTIAKCLTKLFPWGHIQNDNIGSKDKTQLVNSCLKELETKDLVFCDRNNHVKRNREQLFDQFYGFKLNYQLSKYCLHFIALNFVPPGTDKKQLFDVTMERIVARGDNHQSIKSTSDPELAAKVLRGFVSMFQPLSPKYEPDSEFDEIINVDFNVSTEDALKQVLEQLAQHEDLIREMPSDDRITEAIASARAYVPTYTKTFGSMSKSKRKVDYFGLKVPHQQIIDILSTVSHPLLTQLQQDDRIQKEFHVTLMHSSHSGKNQSEWKKYHSTVGTRKDSPDDEQICTTTRDIELVNLVINEKLICIDVKVNLPGFEIFNRFPHITIGTLDPSIKPFESNLVLEKLNNDSSSSEIIPINQPLSNNPIFAHYLSK